MSKLWNCGKFNYAVLSIENRLKTIINVALLQSLQFILFIQSVFEACRKMPPQIFLRLKYDYIIQQI